MSVVSRDQVKVDQVLTQIRRSEKNERETPDARNVPVLVKGYGGVSGSKGLQDRNQGERVPRLNVLTNQHPIDGTCVGVVDRRKDYVWSRGTTRYRRSGTTGTLGVGREGNFIDDPSVVSECH